MSSRLLLFALPVAVTATTARADSAAPGACVGCVVEAPPPPPTAADLSRRFGVGLHVASLAVKSADAPDDAEPRHFGGGGLQLRYRLTRRWELELGFDHLHRNSDDGATGTELHAGTLGAMFHMRPHARWDWYLLAALGGIHEGERGDRTRDDRGRGMFQAGIGLERRFRRLSIGAELRLVGIAPAEDDAEPVSRTSGVIVTPPETEDDEREGDGGARFSIGATYYF